MAPEDEHFCLIRISEIAAVEVANRHSETPNSIILKGGARIALRNSTAIYAAEVLRDYTANPDENLLDLHL